LQSTILSDDVKMNRGPISQKQIFVPLSVIGFHIAAAGFAVIDAKRGFSCNGENR
jgi:hypothetical protein